MILEAKGDSMTGAGIDEGGPLSGGGEPLPPGGSVVAPVLGEQEATVKVLRPQGQSIRLEAR
jgi:SOS-response transcriptional repressor LexA